MQADILLVEDNPITRKMLRLALESEGHRVVEAPDAETAVRVARERAPALVVQDYALPDRDGLSLLRELRTLPGCSAIPILVVTGMVSRLDELRVRAGEHTTILPKPIEPSRLIDAIHSLLAGRDGFLGGGRRILVVDETPLNRRLTALRLRDAGFEVATASSGAEALEMARSWLPEAILSDVLMSGMDGFMLCKAVRRDLDLAHIPVLLISNSHADDEDCRFARNLGARALLGRTPDLSGVVEALHSSLEGASEPPDDPLEDLQSTQQEQRLEAQLAKQMARNESLLRQGAIQAAALSVVRGLAAAVAKPFELPGVVGDVLVHCLDAAGLSTGLLYLVGADSRLRLQAQAGVPPGVQARALEAFGFADRMLGVMTEGEPVGWPSRVPGREPWLADLGAALGHSSILVVPFVVSHEHLGVLVLASSAHELSESSWLVFGRALALQFGQTIAVAQSLSRGAASESRYRSLMEHAYDAILLLDTDYVILEANHRACVLLGRPREGMVGRRYEDFVFPDEREYVRQTRGQLMAGETARVAERHLIHQDGGRITVEVSASLVRVADETIVLFIMRDIGERQRAERELRAVQERLEHVIASSPAVLYTLRTDGKSLMPGWVSANIEQAIGYAPGEVVNLRWWEERLHPEDRERVLAEASAVLGGGHVEREFRLRSTDGTYRWIRDVQKLVRDAAGNPVEIVGSWWDISKRKAAELRLEESEQKYRLLFDDNPQPMFVYDPVTLSFLAVNEAAVRQYGYTRDEFLEMTVKELRPPEDVPEFLALIGTRPPGPVTSESRPRHLRKDGTILHVEVASNPILFEGRRARLVLAADVTEKQKLEAQLLQAQKMEAVGRLAGGVAHDFNNLLGIITGYAELLMRDLGPVHPGVHRAEEIRRAAERAAGLTRQLLAFSRKQVLEPRLLSLNSVLEGVDRMLRRLIGEDVEIVTKCGPELGLVRADAGQIEQVLLNLAVNARDAMPTGGTLVLETSNVDIDSAYCRIHPDARIGPHVVLAVSDTGHGMDALTMGHIFEPFFTTKGEGKGTGLGLATVFGIVKQSGGQIEVYSEVGRGTTFSIYLPRVEAEPNAAESPAGRSGPPPRGTETVLLVEDAEALGAMIREILEEAGYQVLHASTPDEALNAAGSHPGRIHLVLTDVVMPGMSGPEMSERVLLDRPLTKVLFMSGYTDEAIGHHGALEPGTHFIQKPFTANVLLRKLRDVLDAP